MTPQERMQEIANRGIQDKLPPEKRAMFDEALRRGLITMPQQAQQPTGPQINPEIMAAGGAQSPMVGPLQAATTIATGAIAEPVAGAAGLLTAMTPGAAQGSGAGVVEQVQRNMTYQPSTQAGQQALQSVGETVSGAFNAVNEFGRDLGLPEWMLKPVGDVAFDVTGSPEVATTVATLPTALAEFFGLRGLQSLRSGTRLVDDAGNPTKTLQKVLDKQGLVYENLTPEAKAAIPEFATPKLLPAPKTERGAISENALIAQIKSGGRDDALAGLRVTGNRLEIDKLGNEAVRQGFEPSFVQAVKNTSPQTRREMDKMLKIMRRINVDRGLVAREGLRPTNVIGDAVLDRVKFIRGEADKARIELDNIARNKLPGQKIDGAPVIQSLESAMDDLNIRLEEGPNGVPRPVFEGSDISKDRTSQKVIKDLIDLMAEGVRPDAYRAHRLKRQLDRMIDFRKKSAGGLTDAGRKVLKSVRSSLNQAIRDVNPKYAEVNDILSSALTALDDFNKATGPSIDIFGDGAEKAIGTNMRSLLSNRQTRVNLDNSLRQLDSTASELGGQFPVNYADLLTFATGLEDRFGQVAKTSIGGIMESTMDKRALDVAQGVTTQGTTATAMGEAFRTGRSLMEKAKGINDFNAFQTMSELINRN